MIIGIVVGMILFIILLILLILFIIRRKKKEEETGSEKSSNELIMNSNSVFDGNEFSNPLYENNKHFSSDPFDQVMEEEV